MWQDLSKHARAYLISLSLMAFGLAGGALQHTIDGTWGQLSATAIVTYLASVSISGVGWMTVIMSRRSRRNSIMELEAKSPVDKYGYLKEIDWKAVARLEHEHGYDHMPESLAACGKTECLQSWLDDMILEDAVPELMRLATAGIVTTNQLRELTGVAAEQVKEEIVDPHGRPIMQKDSTGRYLTMPEVRAMPVSVETRADQLAGADLLVKVDADILDKKHAEIYKAQVEKLKRDLSKKQRPSDDIRTEQIRSI